jgi:hypothetical protein
MLSGHWRMRILALAMLAAVCIVRGPARAQEPARPRALVHSPSDPELLRRVLGQTSDLEWEIIVTAAAVPSDRSLPALTRLGARHRASVVIWFEPLERGVAVYVADVDRGDLFARRAVLPRRNDRLVASASHEAAALIVRSTLESFASGARIGLEARQPAPTPDVVPPREERIAKPRTRVVRARTPGTRLLLQLGWQLGVDSAEDPPWHGPIVRVGAELGRVQLTLSAHGASPRYLEDRLTRVRLERYALAARGVYFLSQGSHWRLGAALGLGAAAYVRSTTALLAAASPTEDRRSFGPMLAGDLLLSWRPSRQFPIGVVAEVGADVVPRAPILQYASQSGTIERRRIWPVQPNVIIGLELHSELF